MEEKQNCHEETLLRNNIHPQGQKVSETGLNVLCAVATLETLITFYQRSTFQVAILMHQSTDTFIRTYINTGLRTTSNILEQFRYIPEHTGIYQIPHTR